MPEASAVAKAEFLPASQALTRKLGGQAGARVNPDLLVAAERAVAAQSETILAEIFNRLTSIHSLAQCRPLVGLPEIHDLSHDIRCLAGTFGRAQLGRVMDLLCNYSDGLSEDQKVDPNLITALTSTALHLWRHEASDARLAELLVQEGQRAVAVTMQRCGRTAA